MRWAAGYEHPLVLEAEGGPYVSPQERTLDAAGQLRFHCDVHGGSGMTGVVTVGDFNTPPAISVQRDTAAPAAVASR